VGYHEKSNKKRGARLVASRQGTVFFLISTFSGGASCADDADAARAERSFGDRKLVTRGTLTGE
jgi:hypothetical protein